MSPKIRTPAPPAGTPTVNGGKIRNAVKRFVRDSYQPDMVMITKDGTPILVEVKYFVAPGLFREFRSVSGKKSSIKMNIKKKTPGVKKSSAGKKAATSKRSAHATTKKSSAKRKNRSRLVNRK
jgi:hypothetical protein